MLDVNKLKGAMISAGYTTMESGAKSIGMPIATFYRKMKDGNFDIHEAQEMVEAWDIKHPEEVFFG